jgi:hypothetical protein
MKISCDEIILIKWVQRLIQNIQNVWFINIKERWGTLCTRIVHWLYIFILIWVGGPLSSNSRYKSKNDADEAVSVVSLVSSSGGYINGRNFANLGLLIDKASSLSTKSYDKRDDFNFKIINFPNMCSNIPASPAYDVYISQLIRYARASSICVDFLIFIHFQYMKIHRLLSSLQRRNIFRQDLCIGI